MIRTCLLSAAARISSDRRVREAAESHFPRERRLSPLKPCSTENICGRLFLGAPPRANILLWYLVSLQSTVERTITPEAIYYLVIYPITP